MTQQITDCTAFLKEAGEALAQVNALEEEEKRLEAEEKRSKTELETAEKALKENSSRNEEREMFYAFADQDDIWMPKKLVTKVGIVMTMEIIVIRFITMERLFEMREAQASIICAMMFV